MENRSLVIVKIGGKPAQDSSIRTQLMTQIAESKAGSEHTHHMIVHGGGGYVTDISRRYGIQPRFIDGIRQTTPAEMEIIDMGLAGTMNTALLRSALAAGLPAVGLSGVDSSLFTGKAIAENSRTGEVVRVQPELATLLLEHDYVPIVSSVSSDENGGGLNINADDAAIALSNALKPGQLIFISDIPGVLRDGALLPSLDADAIRELIHDGTIQGGMIPKVTNALSALKNGCSEVIIGTINSECSLEDLMLHKNGTSIVLDRRRT